MCYVLADCRFNINRGEEKIVNDVFDVIKDDFGKYKTIVDIGAHIGSFSIIMAKYNLLPDGKIFAFEPDPINFKLLVENIFENRMEKQIIPLQMGIYDKIGLKTLRYFSKSNINTGCRSLEYDEKKTEKIIDIPLIDLSTLISITGKIDYLKCDVEGAEYKIFEKLTKQIALCIKKLYLDLHSIEPIELMQQLLDKLEKNNFILKNNVKSGWSDSYIFTRKKWELDKESGGR